MGGIWLRRITVFALSSSAIVSVVKWNSCDVSLLVESMGFIHFEYFHPCISVGMHSFHLSEVSRGLTLQVDV